MQRNPLRVVEAEFKHGHVDKLRKVWPRKAVTPQDTLAEIQYQAGVDAVLDWIAKEAERAATGA